MKRTPRKLTQLDFRKRVKRVDANFHHTLYGDQTENRRTHPFKATVVGFGWAFAILSLAANRPMIDAYLNNGGLPPHHNMWVIAGLTAAIAVSIVLLAVHVMRALFQKGHQRTRSQGLVLGTGLALALSYAPASVWTTGSTMFDEHLMGFVLSANDSMDIKLPDIGLSQLAFVSSAGK